MNIIKGDDGRKYVEVDVETIHQTEKSVLLFDGDRKEWFPKFALEDWPETGESGTAIILISWATEKEFI